MYVSAMGLLDASGLDRLLAEGCTACKGKKLLFRTYVDARLPIAGAEPNGPITWAYKGETFLDGVFDVSCPDCKHVVFHADVCPRCHREGALATILETTNRFVVPEKCPQCDIPDLQYLAMIPARVLYAGVRAEKARTATELLDPGFHGVRVQCATCGLLDAVNAKCPLCDAPGPIRNRPS